MWPFRKKEPVMSEEEFANTFPPAPCGDQKTHIHWTELEGLPCPKCASIQKAKKKAEERDLLAEAIASRVVEKMRIYEVHQDR